jgi:hypothetical protein
MAINFRISWEGRDEKPLGELHEQIRAGGEFRNIWRRKAAIFS